MADQLPVAVNVAPATVPGNLTGTLAGVAASLVVGALAHAGYLAAAAAFLGQPEGSVGIMAMALVGGLVNYGVAHIAGMKSINALYASLPTLTADYPKNPNEQTPSVQAWKLPSQR